MKKLVVRLPNGLVLVIKLLTYSILVISFVTKALCVDYISQKFEVLGITNYCKVFGLFELTAALFFYFDGTMTIGLLLLSCYFGGAIATDIHAPEYINNR